MLQVLPGQLATGLLPERIPTCGVVVGAVGWNAAGTKWPGASLWSLLGPACASGRVVYSE
jgi:hypothetical protein